MDKTAKRDRFSVDMTPESHKALANLAKNYKITQGEAVEAMIVALNEMPQEHQAVIDAIFKSKREQKVAGRQAVKSLYKQFKAQQKAAVA